MFLTQASYPEFGCDTETYNDPTFGLKSIQLSGPLGSHYFTVQDWTEDDWIIRQKIVYQFYQWMESQPSNTVIYFYNLDFDFSQMSYILTHELYEPTDQISYLKKGQISVIETQSRTYKVRIRTRSGHNIEMVDCYNFCGGVSLNKQCSDWLGDQKIDLPSKDFRKAAASQIEVEYALKDAELTYRLGHTLTAKGIMVRQKILTIGSRTMHDWENWLARSKISFDEWAFGTEEPEKVKTYKEVFETIIRPTVTRGGRTQAINPGIWRNCHHIDRHSMYPAVMSQEYIPHGGLLEDKPAFRHTSIVFPIGFFSLKDGKIPALSFQRKTESEQYRWKEPFDIGDYPSNFCLDGSFGLWEDEYRMLKTLYDIDDEVEGNRFYIGMQKNTHLRDYMKMLYKGKENNTGSVKLSYKLRLNALYGKFTSRPDGVKISYVGGRHQVQESGRETYYLALGSWITSQARICLNEVISSVDPEDALYCDTDSLIFKGDDWPKAKLGKGLGEWGIENDGFDCNIVGPKAYQERNPDGKVITKCAGVSSVFRDQIPFGDLREGLQVKTLKAIRDPTTYVKNVMEMDYFIDTRPTIFPRQ